MSFVAFSLTSNDAPPRAMVLRMAGGRVSQRFWSSGDCNQWCSMVSLVP
jgi:hypothetical protein